MTRILFVDDETRVLNELQQKLQSRQQEWEMAFASGGQAALMMMEASAFDAIVADMRMPGMSGAALLEAVREKYPGVLRIILSGYTELEESYRAVPVAHQFLLKPCDPETLGLAIERATSLVEVLNSKMLASLTGSMQELPSLPRTFAELRQALCDPDTSIEDVVKIVEKDVAITAKVLQLVNSAFFGVTRTVSDIQTAVSYLGMTILQNLVLSVEVMRTFKPKIATPGFSLDEFHQHAQLTAQIASGIGRSAHITNAVVVGGLLHDIGKLVIAERSPQHFARAARGAIEERRPMFTIEEDLIGVSHAEVGAYLLSLWGLPAPVVEAVAHHHHPERVPHAKLDMISAVYLANVLAHEHAGSQPAAPEEALEVDAAILAIPGIAADLPEWREMAGALAQETQKAGAGKN